MPITLHAFIALAVAVIASGIFLGRLAARRQAEAWSAGLRRVADAIRAAALAEQAEILRSAQVAAKEEALEAAAAMDDQLARREGTLTTQSVALSGRTAELAGRSQELDARRTLLGGRKQTVKERERAIRNEREQAAAWQQETRLRLAERADETADAVRKGLVDGEIEEARAEAAHLLRVSEPSAADPEHSKRAKRVMGIAVGRFSGHYLTERLLSTIPLPGGATGDAIIGRDEANLRAVEEVAGVKLLLADGREALRLDGLDGVGREVARRCLQWLSRNVRQGSNAAQVARVAREIASNLDHELGDLGRRAFATLEIPASHPDIVMLVGRLNYRTSFTQNQWKHAIEAAFLCGMMADEMGLDVKLARRAALLHDIGKALTHELDGSHAVIGADYARRLGESEVVANAIGAHHTDEPFNSPYAYLVAAADAMSGARPGARRQMEENFVGRLEALERITRSFRNIEEAYAVQGGREVRIHVQEERVDDAGAVQLSSEIAERISKEMTFPGQIRVTVIREFRSIETAN